MLFRVLASKLPLRPGPHIRALTTTPHLHEKPLPPLHRPPETDIQESFLKGTGPGGQKINKTNSNVQLKHLPTGLVVNCQDTRSREQNRRTARRKLAEKLEEQALGEGSRVKIKEEKKRAKSVSAAKKRRRKYRKLEEEKEGADGLEENGAEVDGKVEVGSGDGVMEPLLPKFESSDDLTQSKKTKT